MSAERADMASHLNEAESAALVHGTADTLLDQRARSHIVACAACASRLDALRSADRAVGERLSLLDVRAPTASADEVIRRARAAARSQLAARGRRAAVVVGLATAAAAAAAAIPASPLRRFIVHVLGTSGGAAANVAPAPVSAPTAASGVSLVPGNSLEIAFEGDPGGGVMRVRWIDGDQVSLSSPDSGATYRVGSSRITVIQLAAGTFQLDVPRSLQNLTVRVDEKVRFHRTANDAIGSEFIVRLDRSRPR